MFTSLYVLSLTVLITFLVMYSIEKVSSRLKKKHTIQQEQVPADLEITQPVSK